MPDDHVTDAGLPAPAPRAAISRFAAYGLAVHRAGSYNRAFMRAPESGARVLPDGSDALRLEVEDSGIAVLHRIPRPAPVVAVES